jgi:hypothetical protein
MKPHTPGPWNLRPIKGIADTVCSANGSIVADVIMRSSSDEMTANALLIASAPDLLEALEKIEQQLTYGQIDAALHIAQQAINEARGDL